MAWSRAGGNLRAVQIGIRDQRAGARVEPRYVGQSNRARWDPGLNNRQTVDVRVARLNSRVQLVSCLAAVYLELLNVRHRPIRWHFRNTGSCMNETA
jgi:hypothetical protein